MLHRYFIVPLLVILALLAAACEAQATEPNVASEKAGSTSSPPPVDPTPTATNAPGDSTTDAPADLEGDASEDAVDGEEEEADDDDEDDGEDDGDGEEEGDQSEFDQIFYDQVWQTRVSRSFTDEACPAVDAPEFPASSYQGKLIDTHLHMPEFPSTPLGFEADELDLPAFAQSSYFGGQFADDFEPFPYADQIPTAGRNITMNTVACTLQADSTAPGVFSFFSIFTSQDETTLDLARIAEERWPGLFTPFISPPGEVENVTTVGGNRLQELLSGYPGLFAGLGEMRFNASGTLPENVASNAALMSTLPVINSLGMLVYMHPDNDQAVPIGQMLADNPDITFIAHGDEIQDDIASLMDTFPNIYYTIDGLLGDQYLLRPEETAESYIAQSAVPDWPGLLDYDTAFWQETIESHPDRFMWGTDRGGTVLWGWDLEVSRHLVGYGRAFIGRLDPAVQERFAYGNAERLIQAAGR
jgi:hypothetical protein